MAKPHESTERLAGWAHDLGKPLQVIGHYSRQLTEQDGLADEAAALSREILNLAEDALHVVDRLMAPDQASSDGGLPFVGLDVLFDRVAAVCEGLHPGHRLRIRNPVPAITVARAADLYSILVNLVDNAMFASGTHQPVHVQTHMQDDGLAIEVSDRGIGMSDLVRERAFWLYYSTKNIDRRTGLGLAECHRLSLAAGGRLRIDSVEGEGTCASIVWPREIRLLSK